MMGFLRARRYYEAGKRKFDFDGRKLEAAYGMVSAAYFRDFWNRSALAVGAAVEDVGDVFLRIRKGDRWTFVQRHWVMLDTCLSRKLVDRKSLIYRIGAEYGWRSPRHLAFNYRDIERAKRFMSELGAPVVVKPGDSSRGNGITTHIENIQELKAACVWAASFSRSLIIEEFVEGGNFRLLFLDGELIAAVRREPPCVIGDGIRSVHELIQQENFRRLSGRTTTSLIPLTLDLECKHTLRRRGLSEHCVPPRGGRLPVKSVINQNASRENHTVLDSVHPSITGLARKLSTALNLELFGMDLITKDITAPLGESGAVINEINTQPGLHYHDLVSDESRKIPVGAIILDAIFARAEKRMEQFAQ